MITKAELAARAARVSDRQPPSRSTEDHVVQDKPAGELHEIQSVRRAAPRAKPVRVTTDLAPQSYRALLAYSASLAEDLGRAKVPHVEVIRALVAELNADPALQATIGKAVRARLSK